jgi:steroid 5-alpha reductase family enzyme
MTPLSLLPIGWAGMGVLMLALYAVQRGTKDAGIVDAGWAFGVGALSAFYAYAADGESSRRVLLAVLAGLWGLRLGGYLLRDRVLTRREDGRYQMLRESWGPRAQPFFFIFFQVQALWAIMFSVPFLPVVFNKARFPAWSDCAGIAIWLVAILGESAADLQLARFRGRPENRGKTCRAGLWRYSRHPNYFFEWVHWFAYVLLAAGSPYVWAAMLGPVVMLLFLYKVTGIPYTEKRALASRGDEYRRYQQTTSAFVPWFPKEPIQ